MTLSAKERKQRQLQREQQAANKIPDATYPYLDTPFFEHLEDAGNWSNVDLCFDLMGLDPPMFEDDRGPEDFASDECFSTDAGRLEAFKSSANSIGRAEVVVDLLLDAASELSDIINKFKSAELQKRRQELEQSDLSDPDKRSKALETSAHLAKLQEELKKNVRRTFPTWRVKVL